ncbi:DEAD/DEAH box helicase [Paenibacillus sp.]|uniref:DEAD/DEAH box helicase n=1 Tax=Paenibacillus sp. TaxID=58172 RepID=UPI002D307BC2|nr:DEAD/DEAH box helicase [Paenibacillus sp.]HZG84186.1 DEAD/DEAH box helicase [Paenibacillus sp.]
MTNRFEALGVRGALAEALQRSGIATPTPVQEQAIPALLSGHDAIVQAQTGTGKTLAFVLPILEIIDPKRSSVQALILTPTRELAIQITEEAKKLASTIGAGVLAVYGGQDVAAQMHKLKGDTHIVVATPGRLLDHLRRETLHLGHISMLVLDEADQMLTMGFLNEVEDIIRQCATQRQTMLFSATMPGPVKQLAANYMKKPVDIRIKTQNVTLDDIRQIVVETTDRARQATLFRLIETYRPYLAVVFCRTKIRAKKLNEALQANGFESDELHGDLTQAKREAVMKRFRDAKLQVLVATDVAARGLDVEGVTHVFNYDVPVDTETYIHRIGRTGRAGQSGVAVTLLAAKDRGAFARIEERIGQRPERRRMEEFGVGAEAMPGFDAEPYGDDEDEDEGIARRSEKTYGYVGSRPAARTAGGARTGGRPGARAGGRPGERRGPIVKAGPGTRAKAPASLRERAAGGDAAAKPEPRRPGAAARPGAPAKPGRPGAGKPRAKTSAKPDRRADWGRGGSRAGGGKPGGGKPGPGAGRRGAGRGR